MFLLVIIAVPVAEVFAFIEVGRGIGWLPAVLLLLATSAVGVPLMRIQGRRAIRRISAAVSQRVSPAPVATDGALALLGAALLVVPGFVTDAAGALLTLAPVRALTRRWLSRRYAGRLMSFAAAAGRFAPGNPDVWKADVQLTANDATGDTEQR
jgi:UPF0716 protein FxsA